ncbi:hypothetical protein TSOC111612_21830 [Tsukamurella ocularis]
MRCASASEIRAPSSATVTNTVCAPTEPRVTVTAPLPCTSALSTSTAAASRTRVAVARACSGGPSGGRTVRRRPARANDGARSSSRGVSSARRSTVPCADRSARDMRTMSPTEEVRRSTWSRAARASETTSGSGCRVSSSRRMWIAVRRLRSWCETSPTICRSRCSRSAISTVAVSSTSSTRSSSSIPCRCGSGRKSPFARRCARPATSCTGSATRLAVTAATTTPAVSDNTMTISSMLSARNWSSRTPA